MVCSFCRRRKIKCDMAVPCSTCVRLGNKGCDVADPVAAAGVAKPKAELDHLRVRLEHLEQLVRDADAGEDMSFHHLVRPTQYCDTLLLRYLGAFRWLSLVGLDSNMYEVMLRLWPWSKDSISQNPPHYDDKPRQPAELRPPQAAFLIGPYDSPSPDTAPLAASLRAVLPRRNHVWLLVDRFFGVVAPHFPVLDEYEFRAQVARVAGARPLAGDEPVAVAEPIAAQDIPIWGILLVALRLAHLSLFTVTGRLKQRCFFTSPQLMAEMAAIPITPDAAVVALACLSHRDMVRQLLVELIQLTALLRLYVMVDPSFSSPDVKNHSFSAVLSLLALCRWLNRDPEVMFTRDTLTPQHAQLLRKLWYVILDIDYTYAAYTGNLPMIGRHSYDVRPPVFSAHALNLADSQMDAAVCRTIADFEDTRMLLDDTLSLAGNVARPVKVASVEAVLARLWAKIVLLELKFSSAPISGVDAYSRTLQKHQLLQLQFVVMAVLTHLFHNYVRRGAFDRAKTERMSLLRMICTLIMPQARRFLLERDTDFPGGSTFDFLTGVYFLHCLWYATLYLFTFYLDYRAHWTRVKNDPLHLSRLVPGSDYDAMFSALTRACESVFSLLRLIRAITSHFLTHHKYTRKLVAVVTKLVDACKPEFFVYCSVVAAHTAMVADNNDISNQIESLLSQNSMDPVAESGSFPGEILAPNEDSQPQSAPAEPPTPGGFSAEISWLPDYSQFEQNFDWMLLDQLLSG